MKIFSPKYECPKCGNRYAMKEGNSDNLQKKICPTCSWGYKH